MCITSTKLASKEFNRELKAWNKGPAGSKAVKETLFVFKALNFAPYRKEKFAKKKKCSTQERYNYTLYNNTDHLDLNQSK